MPSVGQKPLVLGLDFGGSKLAAGVVDLSSRSLLSHGRAAVEAGSEAFDVLARMKELVEAMPEARGVTRVGVCFGGHVRKGSLHSLHVKGWDDLAPEEVFAEHFGATQLRVANDANAIGLAERTFGEHPAGDMLYVTVSTGIGGALILGGQIREGSTGMAGEIGHLARDPAGPTCSCGKRGCLEALAAGPAIARRYLESTKGPTATRTNTVTAEDVATLANAGEEAAIEVLAAAAEELGAAIVDATLLLDLDVVVLGGGVTGAGPIWWSALEEAVIKYSPWPLSLELRSSGLPTESGVWGAAALHFEPDQSKEAS